MHFKLDFIPVPYTRMTQRSKYKNPAAQKYLSCKDGMGMIFNNQMALRNYEPIPRGVPISINITFVSVKPPNHKQDLSNLIKAVEDAANKIIWDDDRWVDGINADRIQGDKDETIISIMSYETIDALRDRMGMPPIAQIAQPCGHPRSAIKGEGLTRWCEKCGDD